MEKLLSAEKVQESIRRSANLVDLVPQLRKQELLTLQEFTHLIDINVDEGKRIDYLIAALKRKGELNNQVERFIISIKDAWEHAGHEDILAIVKEEVVVLGLMSDGEVQNRLIISPDRKRPYALPDEHEDERDSSKRPKRPQSQIKKKLPKLPTNFIYRQDMLQCSIKLLFEANTQILSIVGLPAVGKSMFAMAIGHHTQVELSYNVIYHDLVNTTTLDEILDTSMCEDQCLIIMDNIDNLLSESKHRSSMLSLLKRMTSHCKLKIITTSCKVYKDPQINIEMIRVPPFTEMESKAYLSSMLTNYSKQDAITLTRACGGVPLALCCAIENIRSNHWEVEDFSNDEEVLQSLKVDSFKPSDQVRIRFQNKFSLLVAKDQNNLKNIARNPEKLHNLSLLDKRSLHNSGWLEKGDNSQLFLNCLVRIFLRRISDHVVEHETGRASSSP